MRWLILLTLVVSCAAQTVGWPDAIDSYQDQALGGVANQVVMPDGVVTGQEIVVCITTANGAVPTVTDTLGNTYTLTTPTTTPAPQTGAMAYMGYANSAFTGANTVIVGSGYTGTMGVTRFSGLSGVLDGTVQGAQYAGNVTGGPGSFNTSITTAVNGSLLVSCAGNSGFGQSWVSPSSNTEYISQNGEQTGARTLLAETHTTVLGAYTPTFETFNDAGFGSHATFAAQTLAFKPTASIAIVDTALPDAAPTAAYSAQLHCVGGTTTQTYSVFSGSLPTGLSLNTSTGKITGTTSGTTQTIGFRCTDGIVTSATNSLTLTVQTAFLTPNVKQVVTLAGDGSGGSNSFGGPVACGDIIAVFYHGSDTHGGNGWLLNAAGASNKVTDSLGTVFHRVGPIAGTLNAPLVLYVGQTTAAGTDAISIAHTTSGSGLNYTAADISGVQPVVDIGVMSNTGPQASSPITATDTLVTVVPNELLAMATSTGFNNSETIGYSPLSISATSTSLCCYDVSAIGFSSIATASSFTGTATITTGGPTSSTPAIDMWAFRPAATASCASTFNGNFERPHRQVF